MRDPVGLVVTVKMPPELTQQAVKAVWIDGGRTGFVAGLIVAFIVYLIFRARKETP